MLEQRFTLSQRALAKHAHFCRIHLLKYSSLDSADGSTAASGAGGNAGAGNNDSTADDAVAVSSSSTTNTTTACTAAQLEAAVSAAQKRSDARVDLLEKKIDALISKLPTI